MRRRHSLRRHDTPCLYSVLCSHVVRIFMTWKEERESGRTRKGRKECTFVGSDEYFQITFTAHIMVMEPGVATYNESPCNFRLRREHCIGRMAGNAQHNINILRSHKTHYSFWVLFLCIFCILCIYCMELCSLISFDFVGRTMLQHSTQAKNCALCKIKETKLKICCEMISKRNEHRIQSR